MPTAALLSILVFPHQSPSTGLTLTCDLARYQPGQTVHLTLRCPSTRNGRATLSFYHDGRLEGPSQEGSLSQSVAHFNWHAPAQDGTGYLALVEVKSKDGDTVASGSCGVDVSSRWTLYPRYGYLARFGPELESRAPEILEQLKDFHLDGLQFYDWQWRHQRPLSPNPTWHDIGKRTNAAATVRAFIREAHRRNIACMAYNLGYGTVDGWEEDGVSQDWTLYENPAKTKPYRFNMPSTWETHYLNFVDPGNPGWQKYIIQRELEAVNAFDFDGWHVDQVGDPGPKYTVHHGRVVLSKRFPLLLNEAAKTFPNNLIFNNVGGYALDETLSTPTNAMYTELWETSGQKTYRDVQTTLDRMRSTGKPAILAAYSDYEKGKALEGKAPGGFNTPGVLLLDAAIMANGGSHIELGDGDALLCHEYFPDRNLRPDSSLLAKLKNYYDFATAYEGLLSSGQIKPSDEKLILAGIPQSQDGKHGTVWTFARSDGTRKIFHLINLLSAQDETWRDARGERATPKVLSRIAVLLPSGRFKAWCASPDDGMGAPTPLRIQDGMVFVPRLETWTMLVLEPKPE